MPLSMASQAARSSATKVDLVTLLCCFVTKSMRHTFVDVVNSSLVGQNAYMAPLVLWPVVSSFLKAASE